jgi:hypothetical protein
VLTNHATTSVGYASSSEPLVRFGLGASDSIKQAVIVWPSGRRQVIGALKGNRIVEMYEE